jgi:hypothetical protein
MTEPTMPSPHGESDPRTDVPPLAKVENTSVWEDFIDIFYAPSKVFARRANSGFFIPMMVVTLMTGILFLVNSGVMSQVMDAEMARGMARSPQKLTPEQMASVTKVTEVFSKIAAFVFMPIGIFFTGLALWLCGKIVGARQTFRQALMVSSYAFVPRVLESVIVSVQGLLLDPSTFNGRWRVTLGVGRFLDPDTTSPLLLALLGRVDVFTIWVTVLLAIGLSVTAGIPRSKAAVAAALVWVAGALPLIIQALRQ